MNKSIEQAMAQIEERFPDLAAILKPLPFVGNEQIGTLATDGKSIIYAEDFLEHYPDSVVFALANCACVIKLRHLEQRGDRDPFYWTIASTLVNAHELEGRGLDVADKAFLPVTVDSDEDIITVYNRIMDKPIREMIDYQMTGKLYEGDDFNQSVFGQDGMTVEEANAVRKDLVERVLSTVGPQPVPPMVKFREGITGAEVEKRFQAAVNGGPEEQAAYDACFEEE